MGVTPMLQVSLLKNHAGIMLFGNYLSLRQLHTVLHEVSNAVEHLDHNEALLSLAYDVRKAYEGQRETFSPPEFYDEIGPRFGVKLLWPTLLYQCSLLRTALKYFDSTKTQQGITYLLENLVIEGLQGDFPSEFMSIIHEWERLNPASSETANRAHCGAIMFCLWRKRDRRVRLANLLKSFDVLYDALYPHLLRSGEKGLIDPDELLEFEGVEDAPDPRW